MTAQRKIFTSVLLVKHVFMRRRENPSHLPKIEVLTGKNSYLNCVPVNQKEKPKLRSIFCTFLFSITSGFFNCGASQSIAI